MSPLARCAVLCALSVSAVTALIAWRPPALADLGLDPWVVLEDSARMESESLRAEKLDTWGRAVLASTRAKQETAAALFAGRLTLLEGAARMRAVLDAGGPWVWEDVRRVEQGCEDAEILCRHAVGWVRAGAPGRDPAASEAAADRLEEELNERLCLGTLVLPPR